MKVLILSQYFFPENFRINELALNLKSRGHEVQVLTGLPNYPIGQLFPGYHHLTGPYLEVWQQIPIHRVPLFPRGKGRSWQMIANYLSFVFFACFLGPARVRNFDFDCILVWNSSPITSYIPAAFLRWLRNRPACLWIQDLWPETFQAVTGSRSRFLNSALELLVRWVYQRCDQIWLQSESFRPSVESRLSGQKLTETASNKIVLVPNWADAIYEADSIAPTPSLLPENTLVFAGNLGKVQSLETLLDAAEILKYEKIHFLFVGSGSQEEWLRSEINRRSLEKTVSHRPQIPADQVIPILQSAAASLITLKLDPLFSKTIPSKLQSTLALGVPVIASLDGEAARVIREANSGMVSPAGNAQALARTIQDFFQLSASERINLGENGRAYYFQNFSRETIIDRIEQCLRDLTAPKG